ncbi:MAG: UBP-type zinc finger domain-containing protein [Chloroflexi bacterium]|nr:MAG: UBP-type zinc finger domain-containing protein [Chloroflexota bacterium]
MRLGRRADSPASQSVAAIRSNQCSHQPWCIRGRAVAGVKCAHITDDLKFPKPNTPAGCEECLASGDRWVHLRLCLECGHVGCCDSSPNRHTTKHFHKTNHPVIASYEPGEAWVWCYVDEVFSETAASVR